MDTAKFKKQKFEHRTHDYPVPQLAEWFDEGENHIWTVRGLSGIELGRCLENGERKKTANAYNLEAMTMSDPAATMAIIQELFANRDDVPERISTRIEYLIEGSVNPKCDLELALQLMKFNGVLASAIANKVLELSGKGQIVKKKLAQLWADPGTRVSMQLAHHRGKMLYEIRPDIIPHRYLTPLEIELWGKFFEDLNRKQHG